VRVCWTNVEQGYTGTPLLESNGDDHKFTWWERWERGRSKCTKDESRMNKHSHTQYLESFGALEGNVLHHLWVYCLKASVGLTGQSLGMEEYYSAVLHSAFIADCALLVEAVQVEICVDDSMTPIMQMARIDWDPNFWWNQRRLWNQWGRHVYVFWYYRTLVCQLSTSYTARRVTVAFAGYIEREHENISTGQCK
jgi:hypothetical protein